MSLILKITEIRKSYNEEDALKECSFSFEKKGVYVLMGHNGSGKSTLLRICALLEKPDSGSVNYFSDLGQVEKDMELKRKITLVLPRIGIFNESVFRNAAYGLKIRSMKSREIEERVNAQLKNFGLLDKKNNNALTLSSGEMQRLGMARAMIIEPDILFLDEPTASVDRKNTEIIEDIILKMKEAGSPKIIMSTHDMAQAERLADELLVINEGRIAKSYN